jgi:hypothetical protein
VRNDVYGEIKDKRVFLIQASMNFCNERREQSWKDKGYIVFVKDKLRCFWVSGVPWKRKKVMRFENKGGWCSYLNFSFI